MWDRCPPLLKLRKWETLQNPSNTTMQFLLILGLCVQFQVGVARTTPLQDIVPDRWARIFQAEVHGSSLPRKTDSIWFHYPRQSTASSFLVSSPFFLVVSQHVASTKRFHLPLLSHMTCLPFWGATRLLDCLLLTTYKTYQWPFQEPIDWRYLPYIRPIFEAYFFSA